MEQLALFPEKGQSTGIPDGLLTYLPGLIEAGPGSLLMDQLVHSATWKQKSVQMYDKQVLTPRLSAWYADPDTYDYTHLRRSTPNLWTPELLQLKSLVEPIAGVQFNSVLLNYYRDGNDSVAWHSDNEKALGTHPTIASLSFGQVRAFDIRCKADHRQKYSIRLEHGSLLIMKGNLQQEWEHRIAKSPKRMAPRLNLTFRIVTKA
ncbi:alpha-ketoglutarate-dependent dioxygenase AlkB family protein [Pedobacter ureilyticus]|uniref:Alpha-ketoglutarate-dependent dioxygenase AlkB family protein n=1 Tax=Pedobacter ureilyticus TaxID=1393051 RepID=A0ABW9JDU0_9SPHI|nr:alpha-ketoglutarate-dependent dioxygenase AlkB [Pedobacter helvus]